MAKKYFKLWMLAMAFSMTLAGCDNDTGNNDTNDYSNPLFGYWEVKYNFGGDAVTGNPQQSRRITENTITHYLGEAEYIVFAVIRWDAELNPNAFSAGLFPSGYRATGIVTANTMSISFLSGGVLIHPGQTGVAASMQMFMNSAKNRFIIVATSVSSFVYEKQ